jgi:preprotein translocase subunit YajC
MLNFIVAAAEAPAKSAQGQGQGGLISLVPMILIFVVMFYFMFRSQKKQAQRRQEMVDKIVKGTDVIIGGGIHGTIVEVKDKTFIVKIADKVNVEITKAGINGVINDETEAAAK